MNFDELLNTEPGTTKTVVHKKTSKLKKYSIIGLVIYILGCSIFVTFRILISIFL
jgi:hypothetical protein